MLKVCWVFVVGALLGFLVFGGLIWISIGISGFGIGRLYFVQVLSGAAVGGFVGLVQRTKAGVVAASCSSGDTQNRP
jgi:hypothetical protein